MDGKQILGFINYLMLSFVFLLGLFAYILKSQRKKITFLFLVFLCTGLLSFLFFAGISFIFPAIIIVTFCFLVLLFVNNQEFYSIRAVDRTFSPGFENIPDFDDNISVSEKDGASLPAKHYQKKITKIIKPGVIIYLVLSILFTLFLGYLFISCTEPFYKDIKLVENFNTALISAVIEEISLNYASLILIIVISLTTFLFWCLFMFGKKGKKD